MAVKTNSEQANSGAPAIIVERVSKQYPTGGLLAFLGVGRAAATQALNDVSFRILEGETVGLLGPNGAGKTTLLKIIASLLYPSSGRVLVHGLDLVKESLKARSLMGLVTCDERSFYWRLSGQQNLSFFAKLYGLSRKEEEQRIPPLLETLGLTDAASKPFHSYSSGMKQKLAIARGLLGDPRVVLYDEPTRSLDPLSAQNIRRWIAEHRPLRPRTAHLIATNQLHEAEQLCDRVIIINRGVMIAHGTIEEIRERFHEEQQMVHHITFRAAARNGLPVPQPERGLLAVGEEPAEDGQTIWKVCTREGSEGLSLVLAEILRSGGTILQCATEQVPFDDVFCSLIQKQASHHAAGAAVGGER